MPVLKTCLVVGLCALASAATAGEYCVYGGGTQAFRSSEACASSFLNPQNGNRYDIRSLFDGNTDTAWCEGVKGHGIGETIYFEWADAAPLKGLFITNGYTKNKETWTKNARIRELGIRVWDRSWPKGRSFTIRLQDSPLEEEILLPWRVNNPERLRLTIKSVYPGSKWQDTCVSEVWANFGF